MGCLYLVKYSRKGRVKSRKLSAMMRLIMYTLVSVHLLSLQQKTQKAIAFSGIPKVSTGM